LCEAAPLLHERQTPSPAQADRTASGLGWITDEQRLVYLPQDREESLARGDSAGAGALIPDELLDLFAFSGTPEQVAAQAQRLIDAGLSRVEFRTPHGLSDDHGIELLGTRVLPLLDLMT
jgi:alkanesulfonate monooxygenase SsuD/methylene tetrahydromethanopterin reductase-like flavin-dependent oxidoreductase (luciferase family)